jgi:catechol 2,3-dioxygenase-like lactoylglutathione lyase family enzyme
MASLRIEHVNLSVGDPEAAAAAMEAIFGWTVRWRGAGMNGKPVCHVGNGDHYLAFATDDAPGRHPKGRPLNHVALEVQDLNAVEARVAAAGYAPFAHGDYEPGRRFYFFGPDGIEFEVVSYA